MPKIGFASLAMLGAAWEEGLKSAAENDFKAYELNCSLPHVDLSGISDDTVEWVHQVKEKSGIEISAHAPFFEMNIAALDKGIRQASIGAVKETADFCQKVGAEVMVIHNGSHGIPGPPGSDRNNFFIFKDQWNVNIDSIKEINEYAAERGIIVCLENLCFPPYTIDTCFADLLEIREKVGSNLKFTLDLGHARLGEGVREGIEMLGSNVRHIHLTDNNGEKDDHLVIGKGNFDYTEIVDYLNSFPYIVTMEVTDASETPDPMIESRDYLLDVLNA